jgi:hypothetical protein
VLIEASKAMNRNTAQMPGLKLACLLLNELRRIDPFDTESLRAAYQAAQQFAEKSFGLV